MEASITAAPAKPTDSSASTPSNPPSNTPSNPFDVTELHSLLDQVAKKYNDTFEGHVPAEIERFTPHLNTVRMVIDLSAQEAAKE